MFLSSPCRADAPIRAHSFSDPARARITCRQIALFKKQKRQGVAKFAAFGYSHTTQWVAALFISWNTSDIFPDDAGSDDGRYFFSDPLPCRDQVLPDWL